MAEKVEIFQIEINTSDALKDLAESQKRVKGLKDEIKALEKAEGDNTEQLAELNANLKVSQAEQRTNTRLTQNAIMATNEQKGSINQLRAQLAVTTIEWNKLSEEERDNTERGQALTKQKLELTNALKGEEKATGDTRRNVGNYTDSIKEAIEGSGAFNTSLLTLAANPIVLTVTAIVAGVKLLFDAFKSTQGGADSLGKASAVLSATWEALQGVIANVANVLVDVFTSPKEALKSFAKAIKENLINRFVGLLELIPKLGKAVGLLFKGEFSEAGKVAADAVAKVALGVENFTDKAVEFGKKAVDTFNNITTAIDASVAAALRLQKAQIAFEEANIKAATSLAELNTLAEEQRQIADDSTQSFKAQQVAAEEARKASEEAARIELSLIQKEFELTKIRNDQLKANGQLLRENRQEQADLAAQVIQAESNLTQVTQENARQREEINRDVFERNLDFLLDNFDNIKTINEQLAADEMQTFDVRKGIIEATKALGDQSFKEQIEQLQTRTQAEIDANALLSESDSNRLIEKVRLLQLDEIEEGRLLEVIRDRRTAIQDLAVAEKEIELERIDAKQEARLIDLENELEVNSQRIFATLDLERQGLELKRQQEIEFAERIGADTTLIEEKFSNAKKELNKAEFNAKASLAADFASNIATIAGENTAVGKAAAVAATTINTYQAATGAYASLAPIPVVGPALGIAAAGAAVVSGIANVKKILATKSGLPGESKGVSGGGSISASTATTPTPQTSARANVLDDVNSGIISRQSANDGVNNDISVQPTLVTDQVTVNQNQQAANNETATV